MCAACICVIYILYKAYLPAVIFTHQNYVNKKKTAVDFFSPRTPRFKCVLMYYVCGYSENIGFIDYFVILHAKYFFT